MGEYVNPDNKSKEDFLAKNGTQIDAGSLAGLLNDSDNVGVCLVDNGKFTAAAVAYNMREVTEFTREDDYRPRKFYSVPRAALRAIGVGRI